ncbi:MAG: HNH endonuclease signature motif containing protein, partial [bacterium]
LSTCFKKDQTPWNKGMKGVHLSPATEFKKGNLPHNTKHDGAITIREHNRTGILYKYIRVALGEWELLHRHVWAQHHGPVPDSHIVGFKNGDTLDCRIENLYCMSKADNARRNANREKAARSLRVYHQNGISDRHVAAYMTHDDPQMRTLILEQHPELIEVKRLQLQLSKEIKHDKEPTA